MATHLGALRTAHRAAKRLFGRRTNGESTEALHLAVFLLRRRVGSLWDNNRDLSARTRGGLGFTGADSAQTLFSNPRRFRWSKYISAETAIPALEPVVVDAYI